MYVGLPIVAYNVDFNRETTHNKAFYFNNTLQLQNNLKLLFNDEIRRKNLMRDVRKNAKANYN